MENKRNGFDKYLKGLSGDLAQHGADCHGADAGRWCAGVVGQRGGRLGVAATGAAKVLRHSAWHSVRHGVSLRPEPARATLC